MFTLEIFWSLCYYFGWDMFEVNEGLSSYMWRWNIYSWYNYFATTIKYPATKRKKGVGQNTLVSINYYATIVCCCNIHYCHKLYMLLQGMFATNNDLLHFSSVTTNNDSLHLLSITSNNDSLHFPSITTNNDSLHYLLLPTANEHGNCDSRHQICYVATFLWCNGAHCMAIWPYSHVTMEWQ